MPERRPRIPAALGDRIDAVRGSVPFEAFVREALERYALEIRAEKEPDGKRYRVVGLDGAVLIEDLPKRKAEEYARRATLSSRARNAAVELAEDFDEDDDFYELASSAAQTLHNVGDMLADEYGMTDEHFKALQDPHERD